MPRSARVSEDDLKIYLSRLGKLPEITATVKKRSKYNNQIVKVGPFTFQSKAEARRYEELYLLQLGGEISDLRVHPRYPLKYGKLKRTYVADFSYLDNKTGKVVIEDVKSCPTRTQLFIRNKAMVLEQYGIEIQEIYHT